jgi:hypothetical protein
VLGVEIPRAKLGLILTKLADNAVYVENIHFINTESNEGKPIRDLLRDYNSNFSFNIVVRNKIWKTYNKTIIILDVVGFDMQNKQKFIELMLDFDIELLKKKD